MDHGHHDHGMGGMMMAPPPSSSSSMGMDMDMDMAHNTTMMPRRRMMMHMSFYWGKEAIVLFTGWPGHRTGMYVLSLFVVFILAFLVEWLSRSRFIKPGNNNNVVVSGVVRTLLHAVRMGLAYLVMLAVMSFNGGIFIVAILGHALGFLVFSTRILKKGLDDPNEKTSDLPPMSC